jgi:two-component system cell cycle response regulator
MSAAPMRALLVFDGREDFRHPDRTVVDDVFVCDAIDIEGLSGRLGSQGTQQPDVVLLDSTWSAARLSKTARRVRDAMPNVPVLLLPDVGAKLSAPQGSQGFAMLRAISSYARRRQGVQEELLYLALRDELTGLYNRRAFRVLASRSLRAAQRSQQHVLVFFADLDGLKRINDRFGHGEGDRALARAAAGLKASFNSKSDIVARLGGDEFVALVIEGERRGAGELCRHLRQSVATRGARESRYALTLSVGVARSEADRPQSLSELMAQADTALYRDKRSAHATPRRSTEDAPSTADPLAYAAPILS